MKRIIWLVILFSTLSFTLVSAQIVKISPNQDLENVPNLVEFPQEIKSIEVFASLNDDGSVDEEIIVRKNILEGDLSNGTVIGGFILSSNEDYSLVELYNLDDEESYKMVNNLIEPPNCHNTFAFDPKSHKAKFCTRVSIQNEINYRIKTHLNPQYDLSVCGYEIVGHSLAYLLSKNAGPHLFSFNAKAGENVILQYSINTACPLEWTYNDIGQGFKCKGDIPQLEEDLDFTINLTGKNKEIVQNQKEEEKTKFDWLFYILKQIPSLIIGMIITIFLIKFRWNREDKEKVYGPLFNESKENFFKLKNFQPLVKEKWDKMHNDNGDLTTRLKKDIKNKLERLYGRDWENYSKEYELLSKKMWDFFLSEIRKNWNDRAFDPEISPEFFKELQQLLLLGRIPDKLDNKIKEEFDYINNNLKIKYSSFDQLFKCLLNQLEKENYFLNIREKNKELIRNLIEIKGYLEKKIKPSLNV